MSPEETFSQRKRAAILEAATKEFRARGVRETSMDKISEVAKVSKRTVYKHFSSKDDLYRAITHELVRQERHAINARYCKNQKLRPQLIRIASQEVKVFSTEEFLSTTRVLLAEAFRSPEVVQSAFQDLATDEHDIASWIESAVDDERLQVKDSRLAAKQFLSLLKGLLFWPRVIASLPEENNNELDRIIASSVDIFLDHYEI